MARSSHYHHYILRTDIGGQDPIDIENWANCPGLRYLKAEGIFDIGKSKNIYTEEYADSDRLRVYLPPDNNYAHESTTVTMTFIVKGDALSRQLTIENFLDEITKGIHRYWDDVRNREFDFIVIDEVKISEEKWHGSDPYIELSIPMKNLNGCTRVHSGN